MFGPEYTKINTIWKRDEKGIVIPGDYAVPEFQYLEPCPWNWTEKVDGTNIRLHWNGTVLTIGGRTDAAQVPAKLIAALEPQTSPDLWKTVFGDADDVTVYGEGYGAGIQKGGIYRPDQSVIVFDVLVGPWWLGRDDVADIAGKLGLEAVPRASGPMLPPEFGLSTAWSMTAGGFLESAWKGAPIEGLVGRPAVDLFNRKGERIMIKMKISDWTRYQKAHPEGGE